LPLATDGTMADYCDILRTHNADDTLSVLVLRLATQEILKGQFNGDKLQQVFSFAQELETDMAPTSSDTTYTSYTTITDDSDAIRLEAPSSWTDIDGSALTSDSSVIGAMIVATPDLSKFMESYDVPGVIFVASHQLAARTNEAALLDQMKSDYESCTYNGRTSYKDSLYSGFYDLWGGCGSADSIILHLAVVPESRAFLIYLDIRVVTDADLEALDHILQNFVVVNELP
jgi:serine protease Do